MNVRGHCADLLLNGGSVVESLLDVGRAVGLASDIDDVGGCAIERRFKAHKKLSGRGRGHRARHVEMCVLGLFWEWKGCSKSQWKDLD